MSSDRTYPRGDYPRPPVSALVWLISAMSAAYVLQLALLSPWFGATSAVPDLLRLTVRNIEQWRVWTLATHGFLHQTGNPLHFVFSVVGLVLIGRELEPHLGARRLLCVFGGALVIGAACWLALHWRTGGGYVGPGSGLLALLVVLARLYGSERITFMPFFLFSVTVRPMHLIYGVAAVDTLLLLLFELPGAAIPLGYTPSVHLGGMLAGWLYFRFFHANNGWDRAPSLSLPGWLRARPVPGGPVAGNLPATHAPRAAEDVRAEVNRILDKINSDGFGSLTAGERQVLDEARDLLSKR